MSDSGVVEGVAVHAVVAEGERVLQSASGKTKERPEALLCSPSRCRFRPPLSLTFGLRLTPSRSASTYLRSVLGARGNLCQQTHPRKSCCEEKVRKFEHMK